MNPFTPLTRQDALNTWADFLPKVAAYAGARNSVQPGHENVSRLSACIRFRTLLEDEIIHDTLKTHSFRTAEKWLQEICWRRYWRGWLETHPQVWSLWRRQVRELKHVLPAETLARARAVSAARSGVDCMDKIARELLETGYLHNHARMWWASFWVHVEQLPWELGADFFFRHLLDADPASNTLSWRWVAGLQTPGKTYLVRLSNLEKYAPSYLRENATGSERLADDIVSARVIQDTATPGAQALVQYPTSFSQTSKRIGLWMHADDLSPEIGPLRDLAPAAIFSCISNSVYQANYHLSSQRIASLHTVIRDGMERAQAHYGCPATVLAADDQAQALGVWARDQALTDVIAFAPMVGPTRDLLPRLKQQLEALKIPLTLIRRPSDTIAFSFATAGFFPFWQKMSRHLNPTAAAC
ncbi:MAG: deoxyribodipyrimidine photo-lyase [Verrucomicrobia bacterium]|nr:MAG: deoxyribodipyrimidine photo-lyase [Verrucomicrobiota bacterium]